MQLRRIFLLAIFVLSCTISGACALDRADLQAALDRVLNASPTARRTTVALKVVDLKSGEVLYDRFGERLFTPASNLKIYTSACALDLFGPEHCFPTQVTARVDLEQNAIIGDLELVGGGNAMLNNVELGHLADQVVRKWNVKHIHGSVVVDNSRYSNTQLGPGWMWDDQPYYYNMRVTPLMLDFNVEKVPGKFDSDGDPVRRAIADPQAWIANKFRDLLLARGVTLEATEANAKSVQKRTITHLGTPLAATLKHFNHESENAVGEVLLHEIAIAKGSTRPNWSPGAQSITDWLHKTAGLEQGSFRLVDGSGLSRYNLISADSSVKLLAFMRKHQHYSTFFAALPEYGVEARSGEERMLVRAKSGGMGGVSTISGYLQTLEGRQLAFSLLANGYIGSAEPVFLLRKQVWSELVKYQSGAK